MREFPDGPAIHIKTNSFREMARVGGFCNPPSAQDMVGIDRAVCLERNVVVADALIHAGVGRCCRGLLPGRAARHRDWRRLRAFA